MRRVELNGRLAAVASCLKNFQDLLVLALRAFFSTAVYRKIKMYDGRPILGLRRKTCP